MMKVKCDVEINWIEDNTIDEVVQHKLTQEIIKKISPQIKNQLFMDTADRIDKTITSILEDFLTREVVVTDKWGDVKERHESVNELLKEKFDKFLSEPVDKNGKPSKGCSINDHNRIEYLLTKKMESLIDTKVNKFSDNLVYKVNKQIEAKLNESVKRKISETLLKKVNFGDCILEEKP
jgi:hypothetical protein